MQKQQLTATFWKEMKILKDTPKELETKYGAKNQQLRAFLKATIVKIHGIVNPLVDFLSPAWDTLILTH